MGKSIYAWDLDVGDAVVVRQDRKYSLPEHVEALSSFCKQKWQNDYVEVLETSSGSKKVMERRMQAVNDRINESAFRTYWDKMLTIKQSQGEWMTVPSPYTM